MAEISTTETGVWFRFKSKPEKRQQDGNVGTVNLWTPGSISATDELKDSAGNVVKMINHSEGIDLIEDEMYEFQNRRPVGLRETSDLTRLPFLNDPEIVECLRQRYESDLIYTSAGPALFAANPFKSLHIYTEETLGRYAQSNASDLAELEPHIFQISKLAHLQMLSDGTERVSQSILMNGESGSGKTESTKYSLQLLSAISQQVNRSQSGTPSAVGDTDIDCMIDAANAITESFGNARTSRNPSSSRFGKFMKLLYCEPQSRRGAISGLTLKTYLLESIRVAQQMQGERNFHIFYELFAGLDESQRSALHLSDLSRFHYTNQSQEYSRGDGVSDAASFSHLVQAMERIGLNSSIRDRVFKIVACILHMGNLRFQDKPGAVFTGVEFTAECRDHVVAIMLLSNDEASTSSSPTPDFEEVGGRMHKLRLFRGRLSSTTQRESD